MTIAPNCVADNEAKLPPKLPIGVRVADTIYTSFMEITGYITDDANLAFLF
jgi:hypothetical protein